MILFICAYKCLPGTLQLVPEYQKFSFHTYFFLSYNYVKQETGESFNQLPVNVIGNLLKAPHRKHKWLCAAYWRTMLRRALY